MARNVVLRVRDGDPTCDRAREFVARIASELGLELDVRSVAAMSGLLPQVSLWDGTWLDRVADEATLRDLIAARIRSEEARAASGGSEDDAPLAAPAAAAETETDDRGERDRAPRRAEPHPAAPVVLHGGRRGRRRLASRIARTIRSAGVPAFLVAVAFAAVVVFGPGQPSGTDAPRRQGEAVEAPPLDLPTLDGFRFDLARERGRAVLVVPFDGRKPDRNGLVALAAQADEVVSASRGDARVVAIGVGLGVEELRAVLREMPFGLTVAVDADGRAAGAFAARAGQGAGWWLVDRAGRVVGRGGRPGPDAFAALLASARGDAR